MNMYDEPQMSRVIRVRRRATGAQNELISTLAAATTKDSRAADTVVESYTVRRARYLCIPLR